MSKVYVCPSCGIEKPSKDQIDFHRKSSHSPLQSPIHEDMEIHGIKEKLERLSMRKRFLEKEIEVLKKIIGIKNNKLRVLVYAT